MYAYVKATQGFQRNRTFQTKLSLAVLAKCVKGDWLWVSASIAHLDFGRLHSYFLDYNSSSRSWSWSSVTVPIGLLVTLLINPVTEFGQRGFKLFSLYSGNAPESSWKPIKAPETIKAAETFLYPCPYLYIKAIYSQTPVEHSSMTWCLVWHAL